MICRKMLYTTEHTVFGTLSQTTKCLMNGPEIICHYFYLATLHSRLIELPTVQFVVCKKSKKNMIKVKLQYDCVQDEQLRYLFINNFFKKY